MAEFWLNKKINYFVVGVGVLFYFVFLYFFIFQPNLIWTPFKDFLFFIPVICVAFILLNKGYKYNIQKNIFFEFCLMACIGGVSYFLSMVNGHEPIFFLIIIKLLFFFVISCIFLECCKDRIEIDDVLLIVAICCCLNAIIIIFQFWFPELLKLLESIQVLTGNINFVERGFRLRGFAAGGAASLSLMLSIGILIVLYLNLIGKLSPVKAYLLSFLLLWSLVFVARTGFLIGAALVIVSLILTPKNIRAAVKTIIGSLFCFALLCFIFPDRFSIFLNYSLPWATEYLIVLQGGSVASVDNLQEMLYVPKDYSVLLFGVGFFEGDGTETLMRSDSGYLKTLTSVGVFLGATVYGLIIKWLLFSGSNMKHSFNLYFVIPLLLIMLVVEIKEPFMYQNYASRFLMLLVAYRNPLFRRKDGFDTMRSSISHTVCIASKKSE